ncbi:hypothetical protein CA166_12415 [Vibrio parahaemolyticus]|uniref:hypothetical protein n=1 Tax=Vibrio parahaemolyticus TaxID=670 RepID=UPI000B77CA84|nr:hypothetical protein [Vibrio parahaemolyticus]EHZ2738170.1 hypothetical protein [Vibrio parahaemolyticus]EIA1562713.1 hypothetical protein [Vibrio parahaemolyticus]EJO4009296.1 hypothetical protein [Vibrio parahaemolyticus]MCG6467953.1 hypothetical protein [Vibrio parahaemolyticus]MCG6492209.1 hypothetical protein [Vibrio parahaemolyticus]
MLIRYVKNHNGSILDANGYDGFGKLVKVPALLRNGEYKYDSYKGVLNAFECRTFQKVKLVGFTEYSFDDGKNWIKVEKNHYLIGVRKSDEFYIVLFNGKPRQFLYKPKKEKRYINNVHQLPYS